MQVLVVRSMEVLNVAPEPEEGEVVVVVVVYQAFWLPNH